MSDDTIRQQQLSAEDIETIRRAIRPLDCGALHCRYCDAGHSNQWEHARYCIYEQSQRDVEAARAILAALASPPTPPVSAETPAVRNNQQEPAMEDDSLLHPVSQVYFRAGLIACREYMARFVECESPSIANSIRANWWPSLGKDYGPPRQLDWGEVTEGEYGVRDFRIKNAEEVSPTQEALPIALGFLQQVGSGKHGGISEASPLNAQERSDET